MKPVKKAQQKNVIIDREFYTDKQYWALENIDGIFNINVFDGDDSDNKLRISTSHIKDLKVVLNEYGYYCTVAIMNSGETIHVVL